MHIPIKYIFKKCEEVSSNEKERMFLLMCQNFDHMNKQIFLNDFSNKDYVIVFEDDQGNIQGFSTFAVNPKGYQNKDYNIPEIENPFSIKLKKKLNDIQYDRSLDFDDWKLKIT